MVIYGSNAAAPVEESPNSSYAPAHSSPEDESAIPGRYFRAGGFPRGPVERYLWFSA